MLGVSKHIRINLEGRVTDGNGYYFVIISK